MNEPTAAGMFDMCRGYIEAHSTTPARKSAKSESTPPSVTISRECGAGAVTVARILASILDKECPGPVAWTVFDKNLVEEVLADHDLPKRLGQFIPEDVPMELTAAVEELLGLHPDNWTLVQHVTDTILRLGSAGNTILVGRGGNLITAHLPSVLHVRLIAPPEFRVTHYSEEFGLSKRAAKAIVTKTDRARARYIRRHFSSSVSDPLNYHLCINTALTGFEGAARIIADVVQHR